jgi:hypothetical protein
MRRELNRKRPPRRPISFGGAWSKIEEAARTIIDSQTLRHGKDERAVALAVASLSQTGDSAKDQKFRSFLDSVQLKCRPNGAAGVLLCVVGVGKDNITSMNNSQRVALLDKLASERNGPLLGSKVLKGIASSRRIPEVEEEEDQPILPTPHGQSTIDGETYEHASLEGIATVFNDHIRDIISRIPTQVNGETIWKAAVTTAFPLWGGLVNCLISLDICMLGVDYLAMALFNARISPAESLRRITFDEGPTLIVPNSESTMKGVKEEAIIKVFGAEIHEAIRISPLRRKELEQGKGLTECVSMIVTRQGAIVNLSLDLNRGIEISRKLYA